MEALAWLKCNKNRYAFASNYFGDTKEAIKYVKQLYDNGATLVEVDGILDEDWRIKEERGPYADTLMITLPKNKTARLELVTVVYDSHPDEVDADWNSDKPIRLWWD